jgi:hypothetical protein
MHRPNALPMVSGPIFPSTKTASSPWDGATTALKTASPETVWRPGAGMSSNSATKPASAPLLGDGEHLLRPCRDGHDRR